MANARTYIIKIYPAGFCPDLKESDAVVVGRHRLAYRKALKVVYWLRKRGHVAFAF